MADITVMNKQEQEINTGATQENTATQTKQTRKP